MLKAADIQLNYGKKQVLRNVSFEAQTGDCIGILGTNGCGKSTLLKVLSGVLKPSHGTVIYGDENAAASRRVYEAYTGYVPQDNPLMEELTVYDNLKLWYTGSKSDLQAELDHGVLKMLHLHTVLKSRVFTLSGGMKKRLSIGCALANQPKVLLLDEPTASLDLPCKDEIHEYIKLYLQNGGTVIITTHEEPDLDLCSRLFLLAHGTLKPIDPACRGINLHRLMQDDLSLRI